mmetsp:Transcript_15428/g.15018  ORF Transcript_15428/g.15018 Transcript_15428/m.15018 type:complete len:143 (-) Transcript_15428:864-1292(-)|eukprot:CAMPEP_0170543804 /NCGR_PEP_ID=MMETSP0211-20121228/2792_1 /TAXON_ID=311385 /ORGANISM="Pseudokeronopsis sp., Strain OXSARD2" /LENGTH=142 /DNA_ID=CAMNT_0010847275 /DNA_START=261 /DNA_END=689 /DNA_ORIENTATION=+
MDQEKFYLKISRFWPFTNKLAFRVPLVSEWNLGADYEFTLFEKQYDGKVTAHLKDIMAHTYLDLKTDKDGNLIPKLSGFIFSFWKSSLAFHNDNWFTDFIQNTFFKANILSLHNFINFVGRGNFINMKAKKYLMELTNSYLY